MPATCDYPLLGKFKQAILVLADECGNPICGEATAWNEKCPAALSMDDDINESDSFTRECADGTILVDIPGEQSLVGIDINLDLHGVSPEFAALAGGGTPVTQGTEIVGWDDCTQGSGSLNIYLLQEVVGAGACGEDGEARYLWTILPWVDKVRIVREGQFGAAGAFIRVTGRSRGGHSFGVGGINVFADEEGDPVCMDQPIDSNCLRRTVVSTLPMPEDCGFIDVLDCDCEPTP